MRKRDCVAVDSKVTCLRLAADVFRGQFGELEAHLDTNFKRCAFWRDLGGGEAVWGAGGIFNLVLRRTAPAAPLTPSPRAPRRYAVAWSRA